ncbi:hypothetical protein O181_108836 [Austropuccinia psidii MF-1]|uniref:Uncharacterized protein n=1 Tax=Austropuccinia psidii MF-1 TaxID=1389203 RepID=A0A9Q3PQC8_9BASI|nr:hypothetical protein [Austropuccinia psidii MF-1]
MGNTLEPGESLLAYNKPLESQWGFLFKNHWNGPYRLINQVDNGPYELEELDCTKHRRKAAATHIKRFYPRGKIVQSISELENESGEEIEAEDSILEGEETEKQN